jgi:aminodeoxyfutalosine synthase
MDAYMNVPYTIQDAPLQAIAGKVSDGIPINGDDALYLLRSPGIMEIGALAHSVRTRLHGDRTFYGVNLNLNYTNVCELRCPLCAYSRDAGAEGAYTLSPGEIESRVRAAVLNGIDEVHVVGGLNPELDLAYYEELLRAIRRAGPELYVVGFTATEYDYVARRQGLPLEEVLRRFHEAGVNALPGGGAEVFAPEVRQVIAPRKMPGQRWLDVMRAAHQTGMKSNATLLYGHIESAEQIVDHLTRLRSLQEETGGFKAFVPLAFHPENTTLTAGPRAPGGFSDIRLYATARLFLHNIPHLKALWMYLGEAMAQTLLDFGVDDIGSTYADERIVHAAGATTEPSGSEARLQRLIRAAGKTPVRTASDYLPRATGKDAR